MPSELWLALPVALWLVSLAVRDWRTQDVPTALTALPFLLAGFYRVAQPPDGTFWPGGVAVLLALLGVVFSDYSLPAMAALGVASALAGYAGTATLLLVASWIVALAAWRTGIWGGADGKVLMTLVAFWPAWPLLGLTLLSFILGNVLALLRRYGAATPFALADTARALRDRTPAAEQQLTTIASLPWLGLGTLLYLGLRLGGVL
jgi:hypothetical protein